VDKDKDINKISIIIPTVNRNSLSSVLEALNNQTRKPDEIIIMEDNDLLGQAIMRNRGFEKSKGDLIVFLDDDTVPSNKWLENFVNSITEYNADGVSGNYLETDPFLHQIRISRYFPGEVQINPDGFFGIGGNVMYKRDCLLMCLNRYGYIFNPLFKYTSEDIELVWRLKSVGCKLVYIPNDVLHLKRVNTISYLKLQFIRGRGLYDLFRTSNNYPNKKKLGKSLLWDDSSQITRMYRLANILLKRILGPFDYKSFSSCHYFLLFWIGEKAKTAGFLFALFSNKIKIS
jgi:GT2 family glycosyltransferase